MSKESVSSIDALIGLDDLDVKVIVYSGNDNSPILEDLKAYAQLLKDPDNKISNFNDYIKLTHFKEVNSLIIADLSGLNIDYIDCESIDLSGSLLKGTTFKNCRLNEAKFCDIALSSTTFNNCSLGGVDFRGSDLSSTVFILPNEREIREQPILKNEYIGGIKFSTSVKLAMQYADMRLNINKEREVEHYTETMHRIHQRLLDELEMEGKDQNLIEQMILEAISIEFTPDEGMRLYEDPEIREENDYQDIKEFIVNKCRDIRNLESKIDDEWKALSNWEKIWLRAGGWSGNAEYDNLIRDLSNLKDKTFIKKIDYIIDPSFKHIFTEDAVYDPVYIRGSKGLDRDLKTEYVRLIKSDIKEYLSLLKSKPDLTLNDFAKNKSINRDNLNVRFVADCGVWSNDLNNQLERPDFSNLDFKNANLDGVNFAGANLEGTIFNECSLNNSSFEGARLIGAKFTKVIARDANFFNANLTKARITESDFERAYMPRSIGAAFVENSSFNYTNLSKGQWNNVLIADSTLDHANLEGISMANAVIKKVSMQHALLNNASINNARILETNLSSSLMNNLNAIRAKLENVMLKDVEAQAINFTDAELDALTKLDGADLNKAIFTRIKAAGASFLKSNMNNIQAEFADLQKTCIDNASLRFANLNNAILNEAKAQNVDMTGANFNDAEALRANFSNSVMTYISGARANFTETNFEGTNLKSSNLHDAIMQRINARKADLRDLQAQKVDFAGANLDEAKVNLNTRLDGADINGTQGMMTQENGTKVTPLKQQEHNNATAQVERIPKFLQQTAANFGGILNKCAQGAHTIAELTRRPISSKWAIIGGVVVATTGTVAAIGSAVITGGLSVPITIGIILSAATVGGVGGYITSKSRIARDIMIGIAGFFAGGATGAVAAVGTFEGVAIASPIIKRGCNAIADALPNQQKMVLAQEVEKCKNASELNRPLPDQNKSRYKVPESEQNIINFVTADRDCEPVTSQDIGQEVMEEAVTTVKPASSWFADESSVQYKRVFKSPSKDITK